jgi:sulfur carrier protein
VTATVRIQVNGEPREVPAGTTLAGLVGEPQAGLAAAVNGQVVPGAEWARYRLQDGDRVEFVRAVGGGSR